MAIHGVVLYSPDRHWRITADPAGHRLTIEYDLVLQKVATTLPEVMAYLVDKGIDPADLVQD
jgi:hypothetical protein